MTKILLVTNDFPPRRGGIQSYLEQLVAQLVASGDHEIVVYAPKWAGAAEYDRHAAYRIVRHNTTLMLPDPLVRYRMQSLIAEENIQTVWFGAAAPLALLAGAARDAGASRVLASTHGHEVGWSMVPLARSVLRYIGQNTDVITFVSNYTRGRFASAFGPQAGLEYLPPGVNVERFRPDSLARKRLRAHYGLGERPTVVCVSRLVPRKGQDMLIRALPDIRRQIDDAALILVGGGPYARRLHQLAEKSGVEEHIIFTGGIPGDELPAHYAMADVFAMPCRTRGWGLDVEGLGLVFIEASASGIPVIAGNSGGAPETVRAGESGYLVDGRDHHNIVEAITKILSDPHRGAVMGNAGRQWASRHWTWDAQGKRLAQLITGRCHH